MTTPIDLSSAQTITVAVMWRGTVLIEKLTDGLSENLETHHYDSVEALCGKAQTNLIKYDELNFANRLKAYIDEALCNGCGLCIKACDGGEQQTIIVLASVPQPPLKWLSRAECGKNYLLPATEV